MSSGGPPGDVARGLGDILGGGGLALAPLLNDGGEWGAAGPQGWEREMAGGLQGQNLLFDGEGISSSASVPFVSPQAAAPFPRESLFSAPKFQWYGRGR